MFYGANIVLFMTSYETTNTGHDPLASSETVYYFQNNSEWVQCP